jgi:hypothetical protein
VVDVLPHRTHKLVGLLNALLDLLIGDGGYLFGITTVAGEDGGEGARLLCHHLLGSVDKEQRDLPGTHVLPGAR